MRRRTATLGRRNLPQNPKRILVAHHLLLGDTIMLTPLLAKLRHRHPAAQIVMTVPCAFTPLYAGRPYGVTALGWDPRDRATLTPLFSQAGFDVAYVPGDNRHSWLALAAGARWIVAFDGDHPAYKSWPVDAARPYPPSPMAWGDIVAQLVEGEPPRPYRAGDWPAPGHASFLLPQQPYCVLHVGASTPLKQWEPGKWRALAATLEARGFTVTWSAGPGEEGIVAACDPDHRYASFAGKLDLAQMWHLLSHASLLVSPDTGIAHLARLVGVPTVTLFGPGSAVICGAGEFWRNVPYRAVTIDPFECRDQRVLFKRDIEWVRHCSRSTRECSAPRCMQQIDLGRVADAIDAVLDQNTDLPCAASPGT
ncbi:MAG: glycosyltransferase family 9 protein [Acidobacteriota bacterium]